MRISLNLEKYISIIFYVENNYIDLKHIEYVDIFKFALLRSVDFVYKSYFSDKNISKHTPNILEIILILLLLLHEDNI